MLFQRISRSDPERVFIVVSNGYTTASLTNGQAVAWDLGDANGVSVTKCAAAMKNQCCFAGIVAETIASGEYGLIQVYGYHSAVRVDASTTADIYAGCGLFMTVDAFCLEGPYMASGATAGIICDQRPVALALEAHGTVGTTGTIKAQIFGM
jgi:hypothetical protein